LSQKVLFTPHAGPQTDFLAASEFEVLYGGAAGGGKSMAALFGALRYIHIPTYKALILRRTFPELQELMDRSMVFRELGATWNKTEKRWTFPTGAIVEFGYFERWEDGFRYQGQEYQYIIWDELGNCPEERFWTYLMSRCRSSDSRIRPAMRATANPGGPGHAWLKRRFIESCGANGEVTFSDEKTGLTRRFIPAKLADNPALENADPGYRQRLESLPDILRAQLLEGDWGAASGLALEELDRRRHIVEKFEVPPHWGTFLAMDWGYAHPTSVGIFRTGPEKLVVLQDSLHLWRKTPLELIERVHDKLWELGDGGGPLTFRYYVAGVDCWSDIRARGENVPTVAEQFALSGLPLTQASRSRVSGLNNLRAYVTRRGLGGTIVEPRFVMMRTPSNGIVFKTLESMVTDPTDMEDALKVDADDYGEGGDDAYDMVRYGLASRPLHPTEPRPRNQHNVNRDGRFDKVLKRHPANVRNKRKRRGWF
jgi:hypothetical protein